MERAILIIRLRDRIINNSIRRKMNLKDAVFMAKKLKWPWAGHILSMNDETHVSLDSAPFRPNLSMLYL